MIHCPSCGATLPAGTTFCQFCKTQFGSAAPPSSNYRTRTNNSAFNRAAPGAPSWAAKVYNAIAVYWVVMGITEVARGVKGGGVSFSAIIGAVTALIGLGLLFRNDTARGITNVLCFLRIVFGAIGLVMSFFMIGILGVLGALMMILTIVDIAMAGLMIYLLGETD